MPDLFDNFFGKVSYAVTGKNPKPHYASASLMNSGKIYSYHNTTSNNNYWLPTAKKIDGTMSMEDDGSQKVKARMGSVASTASSETDGQRSRMGSVVSESDMK